MQIEIDVYKWLVSCSIISKPNKPNTQSNGKVQLDPDLSKKFENGQIFAKIIKILKKNVEMKSKIPIATPSNFAQLKDADSSAAKLYNWNIIADSLLKINFKLDNDIKSLIVSGDTDMISELLKDLFEFNQKFVKVKKFFYFLLEKIETIKA